MFKKKYHINLSYDEYKLITEILIDKKNRMIQEGRYTDCIDELLLIMLNRKVKKRKIA